MEVLRRPIRQLPQEVNQGIIGKSRVRVLLLLSREIFFRVNQS
jgi:hypothetical protein